MAPIPIAMCGKRPQLAAPFAEMMLPEYEVIHHFPTPLALQTEISPLLHGTPIPEPTSSLGTNNKSPTSAPKTPLAIFVGADFTEDEIAEMIRAEGEVEGAGGKVIWLASEPERRYESMRKAKEEGPGGKSVLERVVERVKGCLVENGLVEGRVGEVAGRGGLWRF